MCLKSFLNWFLYFWTLILFNDKFGWVEIIQPNSFSVKILAEVTILSFLLNKGYWEIFLIPANFEIKKYLNELVKINTLSNFFSFNFLIRLKKPEIPWSKHL